MDEALELGGFELDTTTFAEFRFSMKVKDESGAAVKADHIIREINGFDRDRWLSSMGNKMTYKKGEVNGLRDFDGVTANLIRLHLFRVMDNGKEMPYKIETIQAWPNNVQQALAKKCKEISKLDEEDETDDPKKD